MGRTPMRGQDRWSCCAPWHVDTDTWWSAPSRAGVFNTARTMLFTTLRRNAEGFLRKLYNRQWGYFQQHQHQYLFNQVQRLKYRRDMPLHSWRMPAVSTLPFNRENLSKSGSRECHLELSPRNRTHWAYCEETQDMVLSTGLVAVSATWVATMPIEDQPTIPKQHKFLWLRSYAFRLNNGVRQKYWNFEQHVPEDRIRNISPCAAIHVRRGTLPLSGTTVRGSGRVLTKRQYHKGKRWLS
jgi:hypothetical protein